MRGRSPGPSSQIDWLSLASEGPTAAFCQPALPEAATLVFGIPTPDSGFLIRLECVLEAVLLDVALSANLFGRLDLIDRRSSGPDREEQTGVGVTACRELSPFRCDSEQLIPSFASHASSRLPAESSLSVCGETGPRVAVNRPIVKLFTKSSG